MRKILLSIEYDGANYAGWQRQKDIITVQEAIEKALNKITGEEIKILGASRTDSGVHAKDQKAIFMTNAKIEGKMFYRALNSVLPDSIAINASEEVLEDFNLFGSIISKSYRYTIDNSKVPRPLKRLYSWYLYKELNVDLMNEGAKFLLGEHDFSAFQSSNSERKSTVRTINSCSVKRVDDLVCIDINGNAFLYNMVRIISGTLVNVGTLKIKPEEIGKIIESCDRKLAGRTLPPQGLCLEKIILDTSRNLY